MLYLERAFSLAWTLGQLVFIFPTNIVARALFLVTWFAKMSVTPTEPLCNRAAELALELDELCTVLLAVGITTSDSNRSTISADELFRFELGFLLLSS